jgi:hypothetical protein
MPGTSPAPVVLIVADFTRSSGSPAASQAQNARLWRGQRVFRATVAPGRWRNRPSLGSRLSSMSHLLLTFGDLPRLAAPGLRRRLSANVSVRSCLTLEGEWFDMTPSGSISSTKCF